MIDENRLRLMSKAALIEKKEKKNNFTATGFYGSDFVTLQIIKTIIGVTGAFFIIVGLHILPDAEVYMTQYSIDELIHSIRFLIILYVAVLLVSVLITVLVYTSKYWKARDGVKTYTSILKKLARTERGQKKNGGE